MVLYDLGSGDEDVALKDIIASRIRREGPLPFSDFMALALYDAVHGYYVQCDPARDYQTSPHVHPVFGACVARQLGEMWRSLGRPDRFEVLDAGAGDGKLALDIATWLRARDPDAFAALSLRLQDVTYGARDPAHARELGALLGERVSFSEQMAGQLTGCILSNELLDAFPVRRVRVERGHLLELRVGWDGTRFLDVPSKPTPEVECYFQELGMLPGEGCEAEANLEAPAWVRRAAAVLERGYVLTLDYGYDAASLYAPWRKRGTLLTFYRHTAGEDPYVRVGRQDITASIDLTTVVRAGEEAGLRTLGLTAQSEFLSALGVGEALARRPDPSQLEAYYALRRAVVELTDQTGLGRIRVLVQGKDVPDARLTGLAGRE